MILYYSHHFYYLHKKLINFILFFLAPAELIRRFVLWNMFRFDEFLEQTSSFIMAFSIAKFSNALSGKKDKPKRKLTEPLYFR